MTPGFTFDEEILEYVTKSGSVSFFSMLKHLSGHVRDKATRNKVRGQIMADVSRMTSCNVITRTRKKGFLSIVEKKFYRVHGTNYV